MTHLWWTVREVDGARQDDVLARDARTAAIEGVRGWLDKGEEDRDYAEVTVEVTPQAEDAKDDPWRCYEAAGGGGRFTVTGRRQWWVTA